MIQNLISIIGNNEEIKGKLWKGAWNYTVIVNSIKKIDVYDIEDSEEIQILNAIVTRNSPVKIDFNCF